MLYSILVQAPPQTNQKRMRPKWSWGNHMTINKNHEVNVDVPNVSTNADSYRHVATTTWIRRRPRYYNHQQCAPASELHTASRTGKERVFYSQNAPCVLYLTYL